MKKVTQCPFHASSVHVLLYVCMLAIVGCSRSALYMDKASEEDETLKRKEAATSQIQAFVIDRIAEKRNARQIRQEAAMAQIAAGRHVLAQKIGAEASEIAKISIQQSLNESATYQKQRTQMQEALKRMFRAPDPYKSREKGVMFCNADPNQNMELVYRGDVKSYDGKTGEVMFRDGTLAHYSMGVWFYNLDPGMCIDGFDTLDMVRKGVASYDHATEIIVFQDGTSGNFPEALAEKYESMKEPPLQPNKLVIPSSSEDELGMTRERRKQLMLQSLDEQIGPSWMPITGEERREKIREALHNARPLHGLSSFKSPF